MPTAYLALGSNLGDRQAHLCAALDRIARLPGTRLRAVSSFHETEPVDSPPLAGLFLNAAAAVETTLPPAPLMQSLLDIELFLGRHRSSADPKNAPRPIDLDLLAYDQQILRLPNLTLPHPRLHQRRFVLAPLAEIAPDFIHPQLRLTVPQMLHLLKDPACT